MNHHFKKFTLNWWIEKMAYGNLNYYFSPISRNNAIVCSLQLRGARVHQSPM
jgi:hypothetical protein